MKVAVIYNKKHTEISDVINIFGLQTKEHYDSSSVEKVASALEKGSHNVKVIEGNIDTAEKLRNFMPRVIAGERSGMVFNMAYGIQGQSRYTHIPAILEMLGVPYVGSGPQAHAIALDKVMSKILFQQHNLPTPKFWAFSSPNENFDAVIYPVIVKPKMESVSMGLKVVDNRKDLRSAVAEIIEIFQQQALVESFIPGREFAVGLLGNGVDQEILPIVEFNLEGDPNAIRTYAHKMSSPFEKICPANIPDNVAEEMGRLAQNACNVLGIQDFARVDFRMDSNGKIYILEINSMASLGSNSSYIHAAKVDGYSFNGLVNRLLDVAVARYFGEAYFHSPDTEEKESKKTQPLHVRIRSYLRSNLTTMEDTLRRMVEINTNVYNTEGVNTLGNLMSERLGRLGFLRQVYPQVEVGNILYFTNNPEEKNDILLLCHLDNRYSHQNYVPFRGDRGRFFGSGVAESKAGLTVMLLVLQALRFTRRLKQIKCGILLTTDDSLGGRFSKKIIEEVAQRSRYVAGLKYGEAEGGVVTSCFGRANYQIELTNIKLGKSTTIPNVITTICKIIFAIKKLSSPDNGIVINPVSLDARTYNGMGPDYATVSIDIQFKEKSQGEELINEIQQIAKKNQNGKMQVRIKKNVYRLPVQETEQTRQFYMLVQDLANKLEIRIQPVNRVSSSEICYVPEGIPVLDGLGPIGGETHSPNEYVLQDSLIDRSTLLALVMNEIIK